MRYISRMLPGKLYKFRKEIQLRIRIYKNTDDDMKVVIGSGGVFEKGWIPTNYETINIADEKDWKKFFKKNAISMILAEHVWEHLTAEESKISAKIISEYLKPGGHIRVAVPDGFHPDPNYVEAVGVTKDKEKLLSLDFYKILYNYKSLSKVFENEGFKVSFIEYYDENGKFHFNEWDPNDGLVYRSERYKYKRSDINIFNMSGYTSLILDAIKK